MNRSIRFHLVFSQSWVLSKRSDPVLPVDWFLNEIKNRFEIKDIDSRISECGGKIQLADISSSENFLNEMKSMICEKYALDKDTDVFSIEAEEIEEPEETETASADTAENEKTSYGGFGFERAYSGQPEHKRAMSRIMNMVGMDQFKELAKECVSVAPRLVEKNMTDVFTCRSYLVSMNDGYGLTTYLTAFAELIDELHLFRFSPAPMVIEVVPGPPDGKSDDDPFESVKNNLARTNNGNIICIDISEWMSKLPEKKTRDFLKYIDENVAGNSIVFFRVPFVEQNVIKGIEKNLGDMFTIRTMVVPPFTNDELVKCADNMISERGYTVDSDVWEVFSTRIASEKSDGRFYGINTVKKIVREMLYAKQLCIVANNDGSEDMVIHRSDILSIAEGDIPDGKSGYEQLEELVGVDQIREKITEIVAQIEATASRDSIDAPCIHMRFVGNPGTGKTTVARIIGTILREKGILRNGNFFEHAGRDLCGRYIGETAPKTSAICRDAYGSVLFIDEAYSLYKGSEASPRDYGREAIDTLIAEMENHRSDLVVIMAGYPDEMETLMSGNAGLKSRMPYLIEFPNYTKDQLTEIFFRMAKKSFTYDENFKDAVKMYFSSLSDDIFKEKEFSNARFVRNLFERTWGKAALRCQMAGIGCTSLTVEDFALATSDKEFQNDLEHKRTIGFAN